MNSQRWIIITVMAFAAVLACAPNVAAQIAQSCPIGGYATVACPVATDTVIRDTIVSRLAGSVSSPKYQVYVRVCYGIVTLTGQVADDARRQMATILASSTRGVVAINNNLFVSGPTPTDFDLTKKAWNLLSKQPFPTSGIHVDVVDGVADVRGEVASDYDRTQAALTVESVDGITAVHNNLIVRDRGWGILTHTASTLKKARFI